MTPATATDARLSVECPKCGAAAGEPCANYKGQHCAPHGGRKPAAKVKPIRTHDTRTTAEEKGAAAILAHTVARLVAEHGCGAVIDAAWEANSAKWSKAGARG